MKTYALSELARNTAAVRHDAARAPVTITDRKKPRFVLMAIEDFEKLTARGQDTRKVLNVQEMPAGDAELLLAGLDALIGDGEGG